MKQTINWAVIGTGGITNAFVTGLHAAEGAHLRAVLSRSRGNAERFAARYGVDQAYTDYDALLNDKSIDAIYIGTPHPTHKMFAVKALHAQKAVLCEKPVALNAMEMEEIRTAARTQGVFCMEAMWTRFVPPLVKVREWLAAGLIGEVKMVQANFGFTASWDPAWRLLNPAQGGGALLDAGVYPVSLASLAFGGGQPEKIASLMFLGETGVDEEVSAVISYGGYRLAVVSAALRTTLVNDAWIYGTQGRIHLPDFVFAHKAILHINGKYDYCFEGNFVSNGYNYEAEAVMDCLREGKTESAVMPLDESLAIIRTMDAIREQSNFRYPGEPER
jgi:predicted dehydrogenase